MRALIVLQHPAPLGNTTTYVHDDAGRRYPDGARVTFSYDSLGNRRMMQDASGRVTYSYDERGMLRSVKRPTGGQGAFSL